MKNRLTSLISLLFSASLFIWSGSAPALASNVQNHALIRDTVTAFVRAQTQSLPGKVSIQVNDIDRRISLPACPTLEAFLPPGSQLNGNVSVGVRCGSKYSWSLFVQVNIKSSVNILTLNKTLRQGQILRAEDIGIISSETLQAGTFSEPAQAIGKIMKYGVASGQILRGDMLRAPYSVTQGQTVNLQVRGSGFRVSAQGHALSNAAEGESISARSVSGQIVSGIVRGGVIEITP